MHNLTVDGLHTYYVVAGNTPVLVHNSGGYTPAPKELPGFPDARRVKPRTSVQGGGGTRALWEDKKFIYEWDSQHGEVEKYNKKGKHLGAFDPSTGEMMTDSKGRPKGPIAGRTCGR
nr:colicin E3/pyocin S6 family cytotoxin [Salinispora sp. H7-4]